MGISIVSLFKITTQACRLATGYSRLAIFVLLFLTGLGFAPKVANACCWACSGSDCDEADDHIEAAHDDILDRVQEEFDADLEEFENWLLEVMFETQFVEAFGDMITQMSSVAMYYTGMIGAFLDAQIQMDTQRLFRKLQFEAHKDYRPSEGFCAFGTNVRSLAASEAVGQFNSLALSQISLPRQLGAFGVAGAKSVEGDYKARWEQFIDTYCDIGDNNRNTTVGMLGMIPPTPSTDNTDGTGLELACDRDGPGGSPSMGARDHSRINRDIDYTRLIEEPRTLDVDFTNNKLDSENPFIVTEPGDEEDIIALSKNLYGHRVLSRDISGVLMKSENARKLYLALRSIAAKRGVAQASFNAIVGMKSSGTTDKDSSDVIIYPANPTVSTPSTRLLKQTRRYMAAIMHQLLPATETLGVETGANIFDLIGYSPSYYAQLEILAKRIYQNPDFYANLYDTPANVSRKKVAMMAIELMVDRAIYESQLRREMNVSVLLASKLRSTHRLANKSVSVSLGSK